MKRLAFLVVFLLLVAAFVPPPAPAQAQQTVLRIGASWPAGAFVYQNLLMFKDRVDKMSGGRVKVEPLPAGSVVGAFEVLDATHRGVLDGAHTCSYYWTGKHMATALFTGAPGGPFGMDFLDYFGWMNYGGGWELLQELYQKVLKLDVVAFSMIPSGPQAFGWFKKTFTSFAELKGVKIRAPGIVADVFKEMGMTAVILPGGEIVPAAERGVIDATEWAVPMEDFTLGIHDVWKNYYVPGMHETTTTCELQLSKRTWDKLSPDLQAIIKAAAGDTYLHWWARLTTENAKKLIELQEKHGVKVYKTPPDVYPKVLEAWEKIARTQVAKDPFFKKVLDSQREYASLLVPYRRQWTDALRYSVDYHWPEKK
jgi:TRAP-type mannitol/chloroaromatic compound transport system substrate-binding protein